MERTTAEMIDFALLHLMNWRIPQSLEQTYLEATSLAEVLAHTQVDMTKTAVSQLSAPGTHPITLTTASGDIVSQVKIRLARDPAAPLLLYHHGLGESPYDSSWQRLFKEALPFPMHVVLIQAPFHSNWSEPLTVGFASLTNIYQMFAGSLSLMELVHEYFAAEGAAYTVVAGVSWGGITSMLYEGLIGGSGGVVPMLASPNLAQAMWDVADLVGRPLRVPRAALDERLDFSAVLQQIPGERLFPLLGAQDLFFRYAHHAPVFEAQARLAPTAQQDGGDARKALVTVPGSHISCLWRLDSLRTHLHQALLQIEQLTRVPAAAG